MELSVLYGESFGMMSWGAAASFTPHSWRGWKRRLSVTMTLFLVHLAEPGGEKKTKLLLTGAGAFFGVIFYGAFFFGIPEPKKENAVMIAGILSALAMGQLGGWLECCLFGEKEPPAPSNGQPRKGGDLPHQTGSRVS